MPKSDIVYKVVKHLDAGNGKQAIEIFTGSKNKLSFSELEECLGEFDFYSGRQDEAAKHYEAAMLADKDYDCSRYHVIVGAQYESQGKYVEAFKRYQAAVQIAPTCIHAYSELGALLARVHDFRAALECYSDALLIWPDDKDLIHNRDQIVAILPKISAREE